MNSQKAEWIFWDSYASRYNHFIRHVQKGYRELITWVREKLTTTTEVLEIGTGTGIVALELADRVKNITAIDPSPEMIRIANDTKNQNKIKNILFNTGDGYATGFDAGSFDFVLISNVLHVVRDPELIIHEAVRVTKPGGRIVLATYCHGTNSKTRFISFLMSLRGFRASHKWTSSGFIQLVHDLGYSISDSKIISGLIPLVCVEIEKNKPVSNDQIDGGRT